MATELAIRVLQSLNDAAELPLASGEAFPDVESTVLKGALDSLQSREMLVYETLDREEPVLTEEAEGIVRDGSHEAKVYQAVCAAMDGIKISELPRIVGGTTAKVGQGKAFKEGWITKDGDRLLKKASSIRDTTRDQLQLIKAKQNMPEPALLAELKKRKLLTVQKRISFKINKGPKFALEVVKEETDLTAEMIASGAWKDKSFKPYNFSALGAHTLSGALHPLNKVRSEFRNIFFEMGFTEMPTNRFVETGFWNFDTLFVPQQHPARDLQDTFYISDPAIADKPRDDETGEFLAEYWENVREVHQEGKFGSLGYRYPWKEEESLRLVLRTHTTAISANMLHKLAKNPRPARYFSIDRVFRNETVDATHLAEFHQVEGVIADYNLTLGDLIGFMQEFFQKMGVHRLRFKPAYNPYTEPSMEIFGYHEGLGKWVEIGNSGMFRPEMLESMGLPKDMRVHGWGLSLERPTMIRYKVNNIRELVGHKVDLNFVESNAAVRLDRD
ncbi:tRNA synthetases class II core domain (F)-domain-containing protein [Tuber borchii]|uniref:Phenylalanine--tRNA ligase alpha subunit n=1 Tax=Tuber borchii TaxID=42251 RepID=A0A2T7A7N1_TUBBO|nr:tRNA synthetases class II core domain (F)-domain-containing protein [Tuber borchii]